MAGASSETYAGGKGSVKFNKSNGTRGLKNKRKAHKRKLKEQERLKKWQAEKEEEMRRSTYEDQYYY